MRPARRASQSVGRRFRAPPCGSGYLLRWSALRHDCVSRVSTARIYTIAPVRPMNSCRCMGGSDPKTGWYSWREIDGRKCWFQKTGAMPPKSQFRWPAKVRQEARSVEPASPSKERAEPVVVALQPADTTNRPEPKPPTLPQFKTVRVRPATGASLRLENGLDLMNGASLSAMQPLGAARRPASLAPAEPFDARFTGRSD